MINGVQLAPPATEASSCCSAAETIWVGRGRNQPRSSRCWSPRNGAVRSVALGRCAKTFVPLAGGICPPCGRALDSELARRDDPMVEYFRVSPSAGAVQGRDNNRPDKERSALGLTLENFS